MGVPKPRWLPDLGVAQRRAVLQRFFGPISRPVYDELLDPGFHMSEQLRGEVAHACTYGKDDWIELMCGCVAPAIPDFNWSAATDGRADAGEPAAHCLDCTGWKVRFTGCRHTDASGAAPTRDLTSLQAGRHHMPQTDGRW